MESSRVHVHVVNEETFHENNSSDLRRILRFVHMLLGKCTLCLVGGESTRWPHLIRSSNFLRSVQNSRSHPRDTRNSSNESRQVFSDNPPPGQSDASCAHLVRAGLDEGVDERGRPIVERESPFARLAKHCLTIVTGFPPTMSPVTHPSLTRAFSVPKHS